MFYHRKNIPLLLIFVLAFYFRVQDLYALMPFTMDEAYQSFLAEKTLTGDLPLIGVNIADTGLYLGPFFTWLTAAIFGIARLLFWVYQQIGLTSASIPSAEVFSILVTGFVSALIGGCTAVLVAMIASEIVAQQTKMLATKQASKKKLPDWLISKATMIGLIAGLLYALHPLMNLFDRKYWNPSLIPLLAMVWLWCIWQWQSKKSSSKIWRDFSKRQISVIGMIAVIGDRVAIRIFPSWA